MVQRAFARCPCLLYAVYFEAKWKTFSFHRMSCFGRKKHFKPNWQHDDVAQDQISRKMRFHETDKFDAFSILKFLSWKYRFSSNLFIIYSPVTRSSHFVVGFRRRHRRQLESELNENGTQNMVERCEGDAQTKAKNFCLIDCPCHVFANLNIKLLQIHGFARLETYTQIDVENKKRRFSQFRVEIQHSRHRNYPRRRTRAEFKGFAAYSCTMHKADASIVRPGWRVWCAVSVIQRPSTRCDSSDEWPPDSKPFQIEWHVGKIVHK